MKVHIGAITGQLGGTLDLDLKVDCPVDLGEDMRCEDPVYLEGRLTNTGNCLVFRGRLTARLKVQCTRCLEWFDYDVDVPVEEEFQKRAAPSDEDDEQEELLVDDGNYYYEGEVVEFDQVIRDNLVVNIPVQRICRENCRGLCPVCGGNRNEVECDCKQDTTDPRLQKLAKLLE